jgi:hypothetical protein
VIDRPARLHRTLRTPGFAVGVICAVNLWILRPEVRSVTSRSDLTVHRTLIDWALGRIEGGHLPLDGWFPRIGLGFPMMHQYQTLPHQISAYLAWVIGVGNASRWTTFLIVGTWPLAVYLGCRLLRLSIGTAIVAAGLAPLVASYSSYGFEHSSYVWRGLGLWAQQWGMWMFPLAMGFAWRAITERRTITAAAVCTAFVMCAHLQTGYLLAMIIGGMALVSLVDWRGRILRMAIVLGGALAVSAWLLVPVFTDQRWSANTEFNANTVWVDSYGASQVMRWFFGGELFDRDHPPVLTLLVVLGFVLALWRARRDPLCRLLCGTFVVSMILFCGKDPFGPVISLLPGIDSLLLHRFISGVHLSGVLLAAIGVSEASAYLWRELHARRAPLSRPALELALGTVLVLACLPAINVTDTHERQASAWMDTQERADASDGVQVRALVRTALDSGGGRIYAGLLGTNGGDYYVGGSRTQTVIQEAGPTDVLGYSLRIPSLLADVEVRFDERNPWHYELFNVRWVIQPQGRAVPPNGTLVEVQSRHELYRIENATGYIGVVDVGGSYPAARDTVGKAATPMLAEGAVGTPPVLPVVEYEGLGPVPSTAVGGATTEPGVVRAERADGDEGRYDATVELAREGYAVLRVAYHPRMTASVDGVRQPTVMVAPAFVGVRVPAGAHDVRFAYEPYPHYPALFAFGFAVVTALAVLGRRWGRRPLAPIEVPPTYPERPWASDAPDAAVLRPDVASEGGPGGPAPDQISSR